MMAFENVVGKGENTGEKLFLLFPQSFLKLQDPMPSFQKHFYCPLYIT